MCRAACAHYPQKADDRQDWFYYTSSGQRFAMKYNGELYYYYYNLQGDVLGMFDKNLNPVVEYKYDSWGKLLSTTGSMAATLGKDNPFRYRGYYYDTESGLYYLNSRYYDPETGRFLNADAVVGDTSANILSNNLYAYCFNNPISLADPTGYIAIVDDAAFLLVGGVFLIFAALYSYQATTTTYPAPSIPWDLPAIDDKPEISFSIPKPKAKEKTEEGTKDATHPKPKFTHDPIFFEVLLMGNGNGIAIFDAATMNTSEAIKWVSNGNDVYTPLKQDALALAFAVSGGWVHHKEEGTGNCAHYHLKGKGRGGVHIFYGINGIFDRVGPC